MPVLATPQFSIPDDRRIGYFPRFRVIVREGNLPLREIAEASNLDVGSVVRMFWGEVPSSADSIERVVRALKQMYSIEVTFEHEFREVIDERVD